MGLRMKILEKHSWDLCLTRKIKTGEFTDDFRCQIKKKETRILLLCFKVPRYRTPDLP